MVERLVKTLKHGLKMLFATTEHAQDLDEHLPHILFGYRCGVHANTHFSPHMILIGRTPRLWTNNFLNMLVRCMMKMMIQ